jgi:hypothetical protein
VVYRELKLFGFAEMLIFVVLVLIGFFYIWRKGALDWSHEAPGDSPYGDPDAVPQSRVNKNAA